MIDETPEEGRAPRETAETFALQKTRKAAEQAGGNPPQWICGADTVVALDGAIFGKPRDRIDARRMLERLSGREHEVTSAVALYKGRTGTIDCRTVSCAVNFAALSAAEIAWYLDSGEWQGVAGAYRLQGLAACFITSVTGSPSAVVGLPLHEFYDMLRDNGYPYGA
jgi:septum formation protein